jgi:hypothetical protein
MARSSNPTNNRRGNFRRRKRRLGQKNLSGMILVFLLSVESGSVAVSLNY